MAKTMKWELTKAQQKGYIAALSQDLVILRAKLGISQAELSNAIGVSRQTYSAVENGYREMSWNTYLSLICFFDNNATTHQMLRQTKAYPFEMFSRFNDGKDPDEGRVNAIAGVPASMTEQLDEQAFHVIRTVVMLEYARCTGLPSEEIIKTFDGVSLSPVGQTQEAKMVEAIRKLRG